MTQQIQRYIPGTVAPREDINGDYVLFAGHEAAMNEAKEEFNKERKTIINQWVAYLGTVRDDFHERRVVMEQELEKARFSARFYAALILLQSAAVLVFTIFMVLK